MTVSAQYAQEHLADLLEVATAGEEVEITVPDKPNLKLIVATPSAPRKIRKEQRQVHEETAWIAANRAQFAGRWVALLGGTLLAVGDSAREVFQTTAQTVPTPLIIRMDQETLPFAGW